MREIAIAFVVATLPSWAAAAEQSAKAHAKPPKPARAVKVESNPCAAYGPGFVRVAGSSTCLKLGGYISVEVGANGAR